MGKRQKDNRIEELKAQGIRPYSISRLNTIDGCLREAYYTYKKEFRGTNNIYGILGGAVHDVLEGIYNEELGQQDLFPAVKKSLSEADMMGISFPKSFDGSDKIKENWVADIENFCNTFEKMEGEFATEELFVFEMPNDRYLIGYIDLIQFIDNKNKIIEIYDFKTSSDFKKDDLKHHGRQLVVYGMAKEQEGYTVNKIAWIMLKYVKVSYTGYARVGSKTEKEITKIVQRNKIAKELSFAVENKMEKLGYGEIDIDIFLSKFKETNSIEVLPEEVQKQFTIEQYIRDYEYSEATKEEAMQYVNKQIDKFEELWDEGKEKWKPVKIDKGQSFYCNNLCSHRYECEAVKEYNLSLSLGDDELDDLF
ncbi:hypothetical protein M2140_000044 [Clostridiales Family XIII bacterium PM5-7]